VEPFQLGITGNAANVTATSNSTLTTLSALSLPGSQVTGNISGNAANVTATSNSTLTTLSALSLPGSQVTGNISGNAANVTATSNSTLTTLSVLSLPGSQVTGNISGNAANVTATSNSTLTTLSALSLPTSQLSGQVTLAQLPTIAAGTILGNNGGSSATPSALTVAQVNTMLGAVTTMGAFDGTPNANGAVISGNTLTLEPASASFPGGVSTGTQTFAGSKTLGAAASDATTIGSASSTAQHQFNGGFKGTTRTITSNLTVDTTTTDYEILCNQSAAISITLPAPTNGRDLIIIDISNTAGSNNITILPNASETINGQSSLVISQNRGGVILTSNGTNWYVVNQMRSISSQTPPQVAIPSTTIDWSTANVFTQTLSANTTFTFANATAGQTIVIRLTNTASNYTVTWPSMKWPFQTAPTMTIGAFSDIYTIVYDGTNYYGSYVQNF
jgi:hypothetical protein